MSISESDATFDGSIPKLYEMYFVPMVFVHCADELVKRLSGRKLSNVLEIAAGTGVVTRAMTSILPESVSIIATDLNEPMLEQAKFVGTKRPVEWRQADAMSLPFSDEMFDAVICQCGVMFFPDKAKAFAEVRRVLRPGGVFVFNTWDRIEENEFIDTVTTALAKLFPANPPRYHARVPHGYHDRTTIERDLVEAGFTALPEIETFAAQSEARSARIPALAYCQGTPMRSEIEERDPTLLSDATVVAAKAIAERFGTGQISGKIQAHFVTVEK
jgi:ubiquinone/menaquinone biosynthesis C-methylase UbiE